MEQYFSQSKLLWKSPQLFALAKASHTTRGVENYHDLHEYSVTRYMFWIDLCEFLGIIFSVPPSKSQILEPGKLSEVPIWFPGARLNYAENLLHRRDDGIACTEGRESGDVVNFTYRQLYGMVKRMAAALRVHGLQPGDRVAGTHNNLHFFYFNAYLYFGVAIVTNSINAIVIALAVASIGGIFSTTATDIGTQGILDRYRQIQPKFIFAESGVMYAGKKVDLVPKCPKLSGTCRTKVFRKQSYFPLLYVLLPGTYCYSSATLSSFLKADDGPSIQSSTFILYSSGTSGKPKCIVHCAGGVLLQTKKEIVIGFDISPNDTYFQYTTTGWMMWNFMLIGLAAGCRIILYDGSPFYPDLQTYLKFINDQNVSCLGTSPRFMTEVQGRGIAPCKLSFDLLHQVRDVGPFEALRTIACTGAPLTPSLFEWTFEAFAGKIHLISTSGGTDVCTSFVTGSPCLPVYNGEIQCKSLGMKVEVFDPAGKNIDDTGRPGELVCTRPHPSLPVAFWGDESGQKFRDAYYNIDGVLNPSGIRFGSAEIYTVLEEFSEHLEDFLCVGQRRPDDKDERVILFLKMRLEQRLTRSLEMRIREAIRKALSARHVPAHMFEVSDIPYTVNGKKIEIAVKQIISGVNVQASGTVANPESLELYYRYREIEKVVGGLGAKL
ncbi:hypothetical protein BDQ17DRAFT_1387810 [Cyathus striatus]|nr:hypothetical protein BDQ17DRAFT_1387810 [Cyathus striatus]